MVTTAAPATFDIAANFKSANEAAGSTATFELSEPVSSTMVALTDANYEMNFLTRNMFVTENGATDRYMGVNT